jgi:hypothetical protein
MINNSEYSNFTGTQPIPYSVSLVYLFRFPWCALLLWVCAEAGEASFSFPLLPGSAALLCFPLFGKKNPWMGKKKRKKIVPKRSGSIFCRGGLRLAGL